MKIYVGNLPYTTTEDALRSQFQEFGEVLSVKIIMDKFTGKSKGFAFVEMSNDEEANGAIEGLNGQQLDGRTLIVNQARAREGGDRPEGRRAHAEGRSRGPSRAHGDEARGCAIEPEGGRLSCPRAGRQRDRADGGNRHAHGCNQSCLRCDNGIASLVRRGTCDDARKVGSARRGG